MLCCVDVMCGWVCVEWCVMVKKGCEVCIMCVIVKICGELLLFVL